jgi:large subunit ribosomal protein L15
MRLNELKDNEGATKNRIRVGRGVGSGKGKTCGRGVKGQKSRTGVSIKGFEGGQMPITRRLPKRGFNSINPKSYAIVNLAALQGWIDAKRIDAKKAITVDMLLEAGVICKKHLGLKLLAQGEIKTKVTIEAVKASKAAIAAVEKAGGKVALPA